MCVFLPSPCGFTNWKQWNRQNSQRVDASLFLQTDVVEVRKKKKRKSTIVLNSLNSWGMRFEESWSQRQIQQALEGCVAMEGTAACVRALLSPRLQLLGEEMIRGSAEWETLNKPLLRSLGLGDSHPCSCLVKNSCCHLLFLCCVLPWRCWNVAQKGKCILGCFKQVWPAGRRRWLSSSFPCETPTWSTGVPKRRVWTCCRKSRGGHEDAERAGEPPL